MTTVHKEIADDFFTLQKRNFTERGKEEQGQIMNMISTPNTTRGVSQGYLYIRKEYIIFFLREKRFTSKLKLQNHHLENQLQMLREQLQNFLEQRESTKRINQQTDRARSFKGNLKGFQESFLSRKRSG